MAIARAWYHDSRGALHRLTVCTCRADHDLLVYHNLDHDIDHDLDHDIDHNLDHDIDHNLDHDLDHDIDHDLDHDLDVDHDIYTMFAAARCCARAVA